MGWPSVAKTRAWTSWIQQEAFNSPRKITQEGETPKCSKIPHTEIIIPEARANFREVKTFAYSYYQFRPASHNLTSEWDFLYNKAHNEYLNYLATTGMVGLGSYSIMIITFIIVILKKLKSNPLLPLALLASYVSYLIYNFFLFSVVIIAIFFYLFPALAFVTSDTTKAISYQLSAISWIYKRPLYTQIVKGLIILSIVYLLFSIFQLWYADTLFAKGEKASDSGNPGRAYNLFSSASDLNKGEPLIRSELAFSEAQAAASLNEIDASLSATLKSESTKEVEKFLKQNPKNVSLLRSAIRTYAELASLDDKFLEGTLVLVDRAITLAPTDPKLYYNKGLILLQMNEKEQAKKAFERAVELKPNYQEALDEID